METKYITAEKSETVDVERAVVGWGSKPLPDRDGELIEASAWDLENYRKNPVLCLSHDLSKPPIGKILWVKADANGLKFKAQFAGTERGKEAYQLYKEGVMTSFSVGFRPKPGGYVENPMDERYKGLKKVFKSVELFEISCVTVPSLPQAVAEYVKSGKVHNTELKGELEELITKDVVEEQPVEPEKKEENPVVEETQPVTTETSVADASDGKPKDSALTLEAMAATIAELKTKLTEIESRKIPETEVKTLDNLTGQPSVYDVMSALSNALRNKSTALPTAEPSITERPYAGVVDIYPVDYPNGFVVFRIYIGDGPAITYRQEYAYDLLTKKASLIDEAIVVEEAWVTKKYDIEELEALDAKAMDEADETKAGKVLSAANVSMIEDAMDQLTDIIDSFQELLDSAAPKKKDDEEKDFEFDEEQTEDNINKDADSHNDELDIDGIQLEEVKSDEINIDEKELSVIIARTIGTALSGFNSTVKDKAVEEVSKLMGKATI